MKQKVLLISPPFVQLNTPYPATSYLKGYLNSIGVESFQADFGIEVILELFSSKGLSLLFQEAEDTSVELSVNALHILTSKEVYLSTIDAVMGFLQNTNPTLAHRICTRKYLPEANRFAQAEDLEWAFGNMGTHDLARHLATLYLEDISDLIVEALDPNFGFSRYAEQIAVAASSFTELDRALKMQSSLIDEILIRILETKLIEHQPTVVGISVPFPGNLYSALKCGQWIKANHPSIKVVMGGGYPNTELRSLSEPKVFDYVDYITLDDGEAPLRNLLEHFDGLKSEDELMRTYLLKNNIVEYRNNTSFRDISQRDSGTPDLSGLPLKKYLSVIETANPMHRLWSDGRWNKLTLAHGCYWGRCTFCDTSLDYIKRFEPLTASLICDRMKAMIEQTGETGFHFVDEAAPPALLKALALEIIKRQLNVSWWTNIRFEKNFTADLCYLLSESGCIAVSGGLEVASDRLLALINKGVSVAQVAKTTNNFTNAGIMVHAYLMYGFPTQTAQETIDSLEIVRQLFEAGVVQSGFWHHFAMTAHSPVGLDPEKFKVQKASKDMGTFANNELECIDHEGADHWSFSDGLRKSLFNYMHQIGFDYPLQQWFDFRVPKTSHNPQYIRSIIEEADFSIPSPSSKVIWMRNQPSVRQVTKHKKGHTFENVELNFNLKSKILSITFTKTEGEWLTKSLQDLANDREQTTTFQQIKDSFEDQVKEDFLIFWNSKKLQQLRKEGLWIL